MFFDALAFTITLVIALTASYIAGVLNPFTMTRPKMWGLSIVMAVICGGTALIWDENALPPAIGGFVGVWLGRVIFFRLSPASVAAPSR
jgi:hypothetical protein